MIFEKKTFFRKNKNYEAPRSTQKIAIATHRQCWRNTDNKTTH